MVSSVIAIIEDKIHAYKNMLRNIMKFCCVNFVNNIRMIFGYDKQTENPQTFVTLIHFILENFNICKILKWISFNFTD